MGHQALRAKVCIRLLRGLAAVPVFAANAPLAVAIQSGQRATAVEMIAKKSADVNAAEADGTTPLIWAANLNDPDLAARLLKAGANAERRAISSGPRRSRKLR